MKSSSQAELPHEALRSLHDSVVVLIGYAALLNDLVYHLLWIAVDLAGELLQLVKYHCPLLRLVLLGSLRPYACE